MLNAYHEPRDVGNEIVLKRQERQVEWLGYRCLTWQSLTQKSTGASLSHS